MISLFFPNKKIILIEFKFSRRPRPPRSRLRQPCGPPQTISAVRLCSTQPRSDQRRLVALIQGPDVAGQGRRRVRHHGVEVKHVFHPIWMIHILPLLSKERW
jgi:hypothetical protein